MTNVSIVFSSSDYYVPYLSVCISSLLDFISAENEYEITILENEISDENKKLLSDMVKETNCSLVFFPIQKYLEDKQFFTHDHVSKETFFKLFIPEIFKTEKILFCDADIIFQDDPAKLFKLNLKNKYIGAGLCHHWNGLMHLKKDFFLYTKKLGIRNENKYFQGGILLFNNNMFCKNDVQDIVELALKSNYINHDQDVLNMWFQNKAFIFDSKWNYETSQEGFRKYSIPFMDDTHKKQWIKAGKSPAIIHYSGKEKPWFYPNEDFADVWWKYAHSTVYYEEILKRLVIFSTEHEAQNIVNVRNILIANQNKMVNQLRLEFETIHFPNINKRFSLNEYNLKLLFVMEHRLYFFIKKIIYAVKIMLSYGARKQIYKSKYLKCKQLLTDMSNLQKRLNR